jgi:hypothetical protein
MADIVASAVAGEAVRRLSSLLSGEEGRDCETTGIKVDRVEMAVLGCRHVRRLADHARAAAAVEGKAEACAQGRQRYCTSSRKKYFARQHEQLLSTAHGSSS